MNSLWTWIIFVFALLCCDCALLQRPRPKTLKKRVGDLEYQVNNYFAQFRQDVNELVAIITDLNTTMYAQPSAVLPESGGNPGSGNSKKTEEIVEKMELFMNEQTSQMKRIEKAFVDEKKIRLEMAKSIQLDKQDNDQLSTERFKGMIDTVNYRIDQETKERNESVEDISFRMDLLKVEVQSLTETLERLQLTGLPVSGNVGKPGKPVPPCPAAWIQWKNRCYLHVKNESVNSYFASIRCHDYGGILAEPDTREAMLHVLDLVNINYNNVWIGASDEKKEGTWLWDSSGQEVGFFKWESGQPNNLGGKQNCIEMYNTQLNDEVCTAVNQYVCQRNTYQE